LRRRIDAISSAGSRLRVPHPNVAFFATLGWGFSRSEGPMQSAVRQFGCPISRAPFARESLPSAEVEGWGLSRALRTLLPRIDQHHAAAFEITCVAGGQRCPVGPRYGRNLRVESAYGPPMNAPRHRDRCEHPRGTIVEKQDAVSEVFRERGLCFMKQPLPPLTLRKKLDSIQNLSHRNRCSEEIVRRLTRHPCDNGRQGNGLHQFRNNVGVKDDHRDLLDARVADRFPWQRLQLDSA
jgi:hypothetical protein